MNDNNFIMIKGWMVNQLDLKKLPELVVYGYLYGYTQNGKQWYEGSFQDIAEDLKFIKKRWIIEIMKRLISAGLIEKKRDGNTNKYRVIIGQNLSVFDSAQNAQPDPLTSAQNAQPLVHRMHSYHISNINNNILVDFLKKTYKEFDKNGQVELTEDERRFLEITFNEIWIDQTLKRQLKMESLFNDWESEVIPVLYRFVKNKLTSGDIQGNSRRIHTSIASYIRAVLNNKKTNNGSDSEGPELPVL